MTKALGILRGQFGRVALLDMDTSLVPHAHPHCHVILKVSGPDQVFTVAENDYPVREDTAVLVNTWEQHHYRHRKHDACTVFLALYIDPSWLKATDRDFVQCENRAFFAQPGVAITDEIRRLRRRLVEAIEQRSCDQSQDIGELIFELTAAVVHRFGDCGPPPRGQAPVRDFRIRRAIHQMRESFCGSPDFDGLARASGLSRPHFNYLFKQATGVSPGLFRNAIRIEESVRALSDRKVKLSDLSGELGFSAQSNFTRFFQQHTGANPNQFRRVLDELC